MARQHCQVQPNIWQPRYPRCCREVHIVASSTRCTPSLFPTQMPPPNAYDGPTKPDHHNHDLALVW